MLHVLGQFPRLRGRVHTAVLSLGGVWQKDRNPRKCPPLSRGLLLPSGRPGSGQGGDPGAQEGPGPKNASHFQGVARAATVCDTDPWGRPGLQCALWHSHGTWSIPVHKLSAQGAPRRPSFPGSGTPQGAHVPVRKELSKFWQIQTPLTSITNTVFEEIPITWIRTML